MKPFKSPKLLLIFTTIFGLLKVSFADFDVIYDWEEVSVESMALFLFEIQDNDCEDDPDVFEMTFLRNKLKRNSIPGPMDVPKCWPSKGPIKEDLKWETIKIEKGFVLSEYLNKCGYMDIYKTTIPQVLTKNKDLKKPNILEVNQSLELPVCKRSENVESQKLDEDKVEPEEESSEKSKEKDSKPSLPTKDFRIMTLKVGLLENTEETSEGSKLFYNLEAFVPLFSSDYIFNGSVGKVGEINSTSSFIGKQKTLRDANIFYGLGTKRFNGKDHVGIRTMVTVPMVLGDLTLRYGTSVGARKLSELGIEWGPRNSNFFGFYQESSLSEISLRSLGVGISF